MSTTWDPAAYLAFDDHRARPFHDLLARVTARAPRRVVDLGCGPGNLTALLAARWPGAVVEAMDSSAEMVAAARAPGDRRAPRPTSSTGRPRRTRTSWSPTPCCSGCRSTAICCRAGSRRCRAGAELAMQVPGNFGAPSHILVRATWRRTWGLALRGEGAVAAPVEYAELLAAAGAAVDVWETTYLHRLTGPDPVLEWIGSTALRPVRDALDDEAYAGFRAELAPRLRAAYPARPDGTTWFPFRRIFAVARIR